MGLESSSLQLSLGRRLGLESSSLRQRSLGRRLGWLGLESSSLRQRSLGRRLGWLGLESALASVVVIDKRIATEHRWNG